MPTYAVLALLLLSVFPVPQILFAQQQNSESTEEAELPKLADMKVPSAEDLVKKPPVAWIVLNGEKEYVIVSEPVYPRPNTKAQLQQRLEDSAKWPKPLNDAERQDQKDRRDRLKVVEVVLPAEGETESPEYQIPVSKIKLVIHHEDLILRRVALLRGEEKYRDAFEMLFSLSQKYPQWPGLGEEQNHLVFAEAITKQNNGRPYPALVLLEQLHEDNPKYPGLKTRLGNVADHLMADAHKAKEYRKTRHFLGRLSQKEPRHDIAVKWINSLTVEATALLNEARRAAENGQNDLAAGAVAEAAKIWPATPGLQGSHARFTARFQKLKVGVLRLAQEKSSYPLPSPAQEREKKLTQKKMFEFSHVDKIPHYSSLFFEQWVPTDLGRQAVFTMRQNRPYWEAHPEVTALDVAATLSTRLDPHSSEFDERLASFIKTVTVESPFQLRVQFSKVPLRTETMFHYPVVQWEETSQKSENSTDTKPARQLVVVSRRFQRHKLDNRQAGYRRFIVEPDGVSQYHVAEVIEKKYESHDKAMQNLLRGEIDLLPHLQLWDVDKLAGDDRFYIQQYAQPITHVLQFNPKNKALRNSHFRRALMYALDRPKILRATVLRNSGMKYGRLTTAPFPRDSYAFNPIFDNQRPYDLTQAYSLKIAARKQLKIEKLPDLKMVCTPDPIVEAAAAQMIAQWSLLGLKVELIKGNSPAKDWDIIYRTVSMTEPVTELWPFLTLESRARVESLMYLSDWLRRPLIDLDSASDWNSASDILKRLHRLLFDEVQIIPLWELDDFMVLRKNVSGFPQRPMHPYQSIELWKINSWYPRDAQ